MYKFKRMSEINRKFYKSQMPVGVKWVPHAGYNKDESIFHPFNFDGYISHPQNFVNNFAVFKFEQINKQKQKLVRTYLLIQIADVNNIIINTDLYISEVIHRGVDVDSGDTIVSADNHKVKICTTSFDKDDPRHMDEFMLEKLKCINWNFVFATAEVEIDILDLEALSSHYAYIYDKMHSKELKIAKLQESIASYAEIYGPIDSVRAMVEDYKDFYDAQLQEQLAKKRQKDLMTKISSSFIM